MAKPASERDREMKKERVGGGSKERSEHPVEVLPPLRRLPLMKEGEGGRRFDPLLRTPNRPTRAQRLQMWRPMKHLRSFFFMQLFTAVGQPPLFPCHFDPPPLRYCLLGDIFTAHCYRLLLEKNPPLCSLWNSEAGTALSPPSITLLNLKPYGTPSFAQTEGRDGGMEAADRRISAGGVDARVCWAQTELCLFWVCG